MEWVSVVGRRPGELGVVLPYECCRVPRLRFEFVWAKRHGGRSLQRMGMVQQGRHTECAYYEASGEEGFEDVAVDVGEAALRAVVVVGEALVVDA